MSEGPLPLCECPVCSYEMDDASAVDDPKDAADPTKIKPQPGDCSLCLRCGAMLTYTAGMRLELLPSAVFNSLDEDTRYHLFRAQQMIRKERPLQKKAANAKPA